MTRSIQALALVLASATSIGAFAPLSPPATTGRTSVATSVKSRQTQLYAADLPFFVDDLTRVEEPTKQPQASPVPPETAPPAHMLMVEPPKQNEKKKKAAGSNKHKEGVFSPLVYLGKDVLGDQRLNQVRGKVIALHSDAIKSFVETAESDFGTNVLRTLFTIADRNGNGKIEVDELQNALKTLGFEWLKEKQVTQIFKRAGGEDKGYILLEEWMKEAPRTLKTNLVKLAKTNGGKMGLLV